VRKFETGRGTGVPPVESDDLGNGRDGHDRKLDQFVNYVSTKWA